MRRNPVIAIAQPFPDHRCLCWRQHLSPGRVHARELITTLPRTSVEEISRFKVRKPEPPPTDYPTRDVMA